MSMDYSFTSILYRLFTGGGITPDERSWLLWIVLVIALAFATIHLLTMLVTRWGDRNTSSKSFLFSLLIHASLSLSVVVIHPPDVDLNGGAVPEKQIQIRKLVNEADEQIRKNETGNVPFWDQVVNRPDQKRERTDREPFKEPEPQNPERLPEQVKEQKPNLDQQQALAMAPRQIPVPKPQQQNDNVLSPSSAKVMDINEKTARKSSEVQVNAIVSPRSQPARPGQQTDVVTRSEPRLGAVDRIDTRFDPRPRRMTSSESATDVNAFLKRGADSDAVHRRSGPAPSTAVSDEAGSNTQLAGTGTAGNTNRFGRTNTRVGSGSETGGFTRSRVGTGLASGPSGLESGLAMRDSSPFRGSGNALTPTIRRPGFDGPLAPEKANIPSTYQMRNLKKREEYARKYGGTKASEDAVELSLKWLAAHQKPGGYWDASEHDAGQIQTDENGVDRDFAGVNADTGLTGLALLAFLGAGYTHEDGKYTEEVSKAIDWLIRQQDQQGSLAGSATKYARTYCHAMATYALTEAYGMQSDPTQGRDLRLAVQQAIQYTLKSQNPQDGGWRYLPGQKSDMSIFGWQLMAIKSAEIAGLQIPAASKQKLVQFLRQKSRGPAFGLAVYKDGEPVTSSMTAEALFCKQMLLKLQSNSPTSREAVEYIMARKPTRRSYDLYYWYYGTLAMYQHGGKDWNEWNNTLRDLLIADQVKTGPAAGSWRPYSRWGKYGGRLYTTALSTLCLEVYYRFLPLNNLRSNAED